MKLFKVFVFCMFLSFSVHAQEYTKNPVKRAKVTGKVQDEPKAKEVLNIVTPVADTNDADFEALMQKAIAFFEEQKNEEAIKIFTNALALSNEENAYRALFGRGTTYFRQKEFDKAYADYTTIINSKKLPHDNARGHVYNMRALINNMLGNSKEACSDYKLARELGAVSGDPMPGFNCD